MSKEVLFNNEINSLFDICQKSYLATHDLELTTNKNLFYMNKFKDMFRHKNSKAETFIKYFNIIYQKNKKEILLNENDDWIKNNNIIIQIGEGSNVTEEKKEALKPYKFTLSAFYNDAIEAENQLKENIKNFGKSESENNDKILKDISSYMIINILKIFKIICDNEDEVKILNEIISKLESKLGIKKSEGLSGGLMSVLIKNVTGMLEEQGIKAPPIPAHDEEKVAEKITGLFNNPNMKNIIGNVGQIFSGVQNGSTPISGDTNKDIGSLIGQFATPENIANISGIAKSFSEEK